jgi:hypothetical protein
MFFSTHDYLIKPKKDFEIELDKLIQKGSFLYQREWTEDNLTEFTQEHRSWSVYSKEFLRRSFDKPDNLYFKEYEQIDKDPIVEWKESIPFSEFVMVQCYKIQLCVRQLKEIKDRLDLIVTAPGLTTVTPIEILSRIFVGFYRFDQLIRTRFKDRSSITIDDEHDVQDSMYAILSLHFEDVRKEEYSSSYAGSNSRLDFLLKKEEIVVETKMTRTNLADKKLGEELILDIAKYENHPNCKTLVIFVYDKEGYLINKSGLIDDLEKRSRDNFNVRVFISPMNK